MELQVDLACHAEKSVSGCTAANALSAGMKTRTLWHGKHGTIYSPIVWYTPFEVAKGLGTYAWSEEMP